MLVARRDVDGCDRKGERERERGKEKGWKERIMMNGRKEGKLKIKGDIEICDGGMA